MVQRGAKWRHRNTEVQCDPGVRLQVRARGRAEIQTSRCWSGSVFLSLSQMTPILPHLFTSIPLTILWAPEAPQRPQTDFYAGNNRREFGGTALGAQGSGVLESLGCTWEQKKNSISNDERKSLGKVFMTSQRQLEWPSDRLFHHSYFLVFTELTGSRVIERLSTVQWMIGTILPLGFVGILNLETYWRYQRELWFNATVYYLNFYSCTLRHN